MYILLMVLVFPGGQVYKQCGSACTPTCENTNPICTKQCVSGCHCPQEKPLWDGNKCITKAMCPKCSGNWSDYEGIPHRERRTSCRYELTCRMYSFKIFCGHVLFHILNIPLTMLVSKYIKRNVHLYVHFVCYPVKFSWPIFKI